MNEKAFYIGLVSITLVTTIVLVILIQQPLFTDFAGLFIAALVFFVILSLVLFYVSKRAAVHRNGMMFIYVMLFAIMIKFGFCLITLFVYNRVFRPETKFFVLPFIGIYVIYTIFETYFMMKLGRIKKQELR